MENKSETSVLLAATPEFIARRILLVRGQKVMLDSDLAELYQVSTKNLNKAIQRNITRFPGDFMFRLSRKETKDLRFQFGTSSLGHGGRRYDPYVFTELGVAMLSSVLKSDRAIQMNIFIMRAFVKLRELLSTHADLAEKIEELEKNQTEQNVHLVNIFKKLNKLTEAMTPQHDAIGFEV